MCLVLLADEVDAEQTAHGAVCAVASDDVTGAHAVAAGALDRHSVAVLRQSDHFGAPDDLDAELVGACLQHPFRPALRNDEHHPEPGGQLAKIQRRAARRGDLTHRHPARQQLPCQTSRVKQLQSPGVYRECPGDVGRIDALFEQPRLGATERQLARKHQPRRSGADHDNVGGGHDPDISRSVRFAVLVEPIGEFAAPTDRTNSSFGGLPGPRGGDDEQLVAGLDTGIGLQERTNVRL